jgi:hypothetical protein
MRRSMDKTEARKVFRDKVVEQAEQGNIVFMGIEGPMVTNLEEFIKQPIEGILYDLNRLPEVIMTFIDDPKWVNDYAVYLVIKRLKELLDLSKKAA